MKILIINAFGESKKARRQFEHFYNIVMAAVEKHRDGDDIIVDVRTHTTLDDYVYLPQEVYGITPAVKKSAKEVFRQADADNSGTIDADEMYHLVQLLFQRLGVPLRPEFLPVLKEEVMLALELYDDDGSGELEFDEFCSVLCKDPWRELLPADNRKKEDANRSMRNFCMCDLIFCDGDPHILPWDKGAVDLLALVRQCMYSQQWPKPACITMLGSAVVTQMMQYLQLVGAKVLPIFNGNPPGVGTKIGMITQIDLSQEAPKVGGLFLDHSTGDTFKWNRKKFDEKFPKRAWEYQVNVGMIMHAGRKEPPRKYDSSGELQDSTKTIVKRETKAYQHWLFKGLGKGQFFAPVHRNWDVQMRIEGKELKCLATSMRGVEILEDQKSAVIGTMFSFHPVFRDTVVLVTNFVREKFHYLRVNEDSKDTWYEWMLASANNGKLKFWFPPPFKNYTQPVGLQLKKRPKQLSAAQQRMVEQVGRVKPQNATKKVMDENGNLVDADEVADPNKEKLDKEKAKRDAAADKDKEEFEKANRWDAGRDAPTMKKLMSVNKARCIETFDPATGVSSKAGDLGQDDNLFDKMKRGEEDELESEGSEAMGPPLTPKRPQTALGLRNVWTPDPATKRVIKPIRRMRSALPRKAGASPAVPGPNATRYEIEQAQKAKQQKEARNMTPEGYRPDCMFNTMMARKEGAAEKSADSFVPNPYVSDNERIKKQDKLNVARWIGSAFLTASGPRPARKSMYASEEYNKFSFNRPIHKNRWMRDSDFIKMGRTLQPFDGPLKEPKKPTNRRPASRA